MRVLLEFIVGGGALVIVAVYVRYVKNKIGQRNRYQARFISGPLDGEVKHVKTLPSTFQVTIGHEENNILVALYKLDDSNLGIYTYQKDVWYAKGSSITNQLERK